MSVAIVSTSINSRPDAYAAWAAQGDLIVAGDRNSPPELAGYVKELGGRYLAPDEQLSWRFSKSLGWNCVQRRNVAVMTAFADGYDFIATVDDDNFPTTGDWIEQHVSHVVNGSDANEVRGADAWGWVNIGQYVVPWTHQRGTPLGFPTESFRAPRRLHSEIAVSTAQVLGDPDCDAISRVLRQPQVRHVLEDVVVQPGQFAAFNSQATVWRGDWAPAMACLPDVGRYDDIFAAFIACSLFAYHELGIYAGRPCVLQARNLHDPLKDLASELGGMRTTLAFTHALALITHSDMRPHVMYARVADEIARFDVLPERTVAFIKHWAATWTELVGDRP